MLSDYKRGIEKLELGLISDKSSNEISSNKYAIKLIMIGEELEGLIDYRKKLAEKIELENLEGKTENEINRVDSKINTEVSRLDNRIDEINII